MILVLQGSMITVAKWRIVLVRNESAKVKQQNTNTEELLMLLIQKTAEC